MKIKFFIENKIFHSVKKGVFLTKLIFDYEKTFYELLSISKFASDGF